MSLRPVVPTVLLTAALAAAGCSPSDPPTEPTVPPTVSPGTESGAPTPRGAPPTPYSDPDDIHADYDGVIAEARQAAETGVGPVTWETEDPHLIATAREGECAIKAEVVGTGAPPKDYDLDALRTDLSGALAHHDFAEVADFDHGGGWVVLRSTDSRGAMFQFRAKRAVEIMVEVPAQCPE